MKHTTKAGIALLYGPWTPKFTSLGVHVWTKTRKLSVLFLGLRRNLSEHRLRSLLQRRSNKFFWLVLYIAWRKYACKFQDTGREINAGHRTLSGKNGAMSGWNISLLDIMSGKKCCTVGHNFLLFGRKPFRYWLAGGFACHILHFQIWQFQRRQRCPGEIKISRTPCLAVMFLLFPGLRYRKIFRISSPLASTGKMSGRKICQWRFQALITASTVLERFYCGFSILSRWEVVKKW